jgi:hypothetical protein
MGLPLEPALILKMLHDFARDVTRERRATLLDITNRSKQPGRRAGL